MTGLDNWADDRFDRRDFSVFLTKVLAVQTHAVSAKGEQRGWSVALDASWGAGKSYFVRRWAQDLRDIGYPVVLFDAWENDIGSEPSIALMAEVNREMKIWSKKIPKTNLVKNRANDLIKETGKKLRRSLMPLSKIVVSSLLKRAVGVGISEITDALSLDVESDSSKFSADELLDKAFDLSLEGQIQRKENISQFKIKLVELLEILKQEANAKLPLFVFVDELDRCRPTYAISMLEEIKHIFGMNNVCFVLSTNLSELRHSICAVYGQSFSSEIYLKRFFDVSIELPDSNSGEFVRDLFDLTNSIKKKIHFTAIPDDRPTNFKTEMFAISWIFNSFELDARSQKQAFHIADTVAEFLEVNVIHTTFLFFLCALFIKSKEKFDSLAGGGSLPEVIDSVIKRNIPCVYRDVRGNGHQKAELKMSNVIYEYLRCANLEIEEIRKKASRFDGTDPLVMISMNLMEEFQSQSIRKEKPSIADYFKLVRNAGYLKR